MTKEMVRVSLKIKDFFTPYFIVAGYYQVQKAAGEGVTLPKVNIKYETNISC